MKYFLICIIFSVFLGLTGCSTNENDPISGEPKGQTLNLTVTASEVYFLKFDELSEVTVDDPLFNSDWDISIENLTNIKLNGGATAPGSVYAKVLTDMPFEDVTAAPDDIYQTDDQNGPYIGENWYYYDVNTHMVNPVDDTYVIKSVSGDYYKFRITDAVFTSRTDGELKIVIDKVSPPASAEMVSSLGRVLTVRMPLIAGSNTFFNLKEATVTDITTPSSSLNWDFYSDFTTIYSNGGSSGSGNFSAMVYQNMDFDSIETVPAGNYVMDDSTNNTWAIGDSWYDYNMQTHQLSVNSNVYIVKTVDGNHAKLQFIAKNFGSQSGGEAVIKYQYIQGTEF
jgi:hypothetical protein